MTRRLPSRLDSSRGLSGWTSTTGLEWSGVDWTGRLGGLGGLGLLLVPRITYVYSLTYLSFIHSCRHASRLAILVLD